MIRIMGNSIADLPARQVRIDCLVRFPENLSQICGYPMNRFLTNQKYLSITCDIFSIIRGLIYQAYQTI